MTPYPYHMRRRSQRPLSYGQVNRMREEKEMQRLEEQIWRCIERQGIKGFLAVEAIACTAWDALAAEGRLPRAEDITSFDVP